MPDRAEMKAGAVIGIVCLVAAPLFAGNMVHVYVEEAGTAAFSVYPYFRVRVENYTGVTQRYRIDISPAIGGIQQGWRGLSVGSYGLSSGAVNNGGDHVFDGSYPFLSFETIAVGDSTAILGSFEEYRVIRVAVHANTGNSNAHRWKRILAIKDTVIKVTGFRTRNATRTEPVIIGDWIDLDFDDVGQSFEPVPYRNIGDWPVEFRSPSGKWGAAHGSNGLYGLTLAPGWETLYLAGLHVENGPYTWEPGSPGVWQFATYEGPEEGGGSGSSEVDFSPAVQLVERNSYVLFAGFAALLVAFGLRRLFNA